MSYYLDMDCENCGRHRVEANYVCEKCRFDNQKHEYVSREDGRTGEGFCTYCGEKIDSFDGLKKCPFCGTEDIPCSYDNQVNISINWHELHILIVWAENYANQCAGKDITMINVVYSIAHRLEKQFPSKNCLTLAGELSNLKREFPGAKITYPRVE